MQWTADRNGGFSKADPSKLYLPAISDSVYGFNVTNVESQRQSPHSLLHWMKQMIARRKQQRAFGRGALRFLRPQNDKVLAYVREYEEVNLLLVHNLAGSAQPVELDLAQFEGRVPIELLGGSRFPIIGKRPYTMSLAPYGYYWFKLEEKSSDDLSYGIEGSVV
jgi:maltose alpha-D-glucosyltransferase/alpha-amylase